MLMMLMFTKLALMKPVNSTPKALVSVVAMLEIDGLRLLSPSPLLVNNSSLNSLVCSLTVLILITLLGVLENFTFWPLQVNPMLLFLLMNLTLPTSTLKSGQPLMLVIINSLHVVVNQSWVVKLLLRVLLLFVVLVLFPLTHS